MRHMRCYSTLLAVLSIVQVGTAQDEPQQAPQEVDPAAIEKLFEDFATPGPEHKEFRRLVGEWKTESKSFFPNPAEPTVTEGKARFTLLLGGRYLQQRFEGTFDGKPFEGLGISGYDKAQKKYVGVWVDNGGTGIMHTSGTYDEESKTMTETGESSSPLGNMKMRMVTKDVSDDEFHFTMFMQMPGAEEEMKMMEIKYTRQGKGADN